MCLACILLAVDAFASPEYEKDWVKAGGKHGSGQLLWMT